MANVKLLPIDFLTGCGRKSLVLSSLGVPAGDPVTPLPPPPPTAKSFPRTASICPGITTMKHVSSVSTMPLIPAVVEEFIVPHAFYFVG